VVHTALEAVGQLRTVRLRAGAGRVRRRWWRCHAAHQSHAVAERVPREAEGHCSWQRRVQRHRQPTERELRRGCCGGGSGRGHRQERGEHNTGAARRHRNEFSETCAATSAAAALRHSVALTVAAAAAGSWGTAAAAPSRGGLVISPVFFATSHFGYRPRYKAVSYAPAASLAVAARCCPGLAWQRWPRAAGTV
jgi:hypothetical protein